MQNKYKWLENVIPLWVFSSRSVTFADQSTNLCWPISESTNPHIQVGFLLQQALYYDTLRRNWIWHGRNGKGHHLRWQLHLQWTDTFSNKKHTDDMMNNAHTLYWTITTRWTPNTPHSPRQRMCPWQSWGNRHCHQAHPRGGCPGWWGWTTRSSSPLPS